jgi:hypothetical protein
MVRVAVMGGEGVGKSNLCFSFAKFLSKRGIGAAPVNFDPGCKHLQYEVAFDIRKRHSLKKLMKEHKVTESQALAEIYSAAALDPAVKELAAANPCVLLDFRGGAQFILLEGGAELMPLLADRIILVADNRAIPAAASALRQAIEKETGLPTIAAINKPDLLRKRPATLLEHSEEGTDGKTLKISAIEGEGFDKLARLANLL